MALPCRRVETFVGRLSRDLERFAANPLFLGIRYGYLWGRDLREALAKPAFIEGLKLMAS